MDIYANDTYGEHVAAYYDEWYSEYDQAAITLLAEIAGNGRALELGIGTGRFALPLTSKNVPVQGIDAADSMVERLRNKPASDQIHISMGDFPDVDVEGMFR